MKVKGTKYVAADEIHDKKMLKKDMKKMKRAGLAVALKDAEKKKSAKLVKVKPQKKFGSISDKKGKVI